jgi:hypothetical protein
MHKLPTDNRLDSDERQSSPLHIDLGFGSDPPFPFLIGGFLIDSDGSRQLATESLRTQQGSRPPGLTWFQHQYGGARCIQAALLGYAVRLPTDPHTQQILRELYSAHADTVQEQLTDKALCTIHTQLHTLFPETGLVYGTEALLVSAPCESLHALKGREVFTVRHAVEPSRRYIDCSFDRCDFLACGTFSDAHTSALRAIGQAVGMTPRVLLLWGNSD